MATKMNGFIGYPLIVISRGAGREQSAEVAKTPSELPSRYFAFGKMQAQTIHQ